MVQNETNGRSVLVVEDEPGIAKVCMRTLTAEGFQVDIAENGEVAIEMWRVKTTTSVLAISGHLV